MREAGTPSGGGEARAGQARRPTMTDVARAAGVSVMTVSYVYSRPGRVAEATAAKVRRAARRLGYPGPHPGARSLRRGRAGSLGVVLGEPLTYAFEDPQAARFLAGVAGVCGEERVGLTLVPITGAADDVERVAEAAVDGFVVWTTSDDDPVVDAVAATGLPAVVQGGPGQRGLAVVGIDDLAAARAIGGEAFAGARRPAVLSFPLDRARRTATIHGPDPAAATFPVTRRRLEGLRDACVATGHAWEHVPVHVCSRNSAAEGEAAADALLRGPDAPDAIAAMSDELALGALRAAAKGGVPVPEGLAVTGWDDGEAAAAAGLTTVAQSLHDQGARCARLALGGGATGVEEASWRIVRRASTRGWAGPRGARTRTPIPPV
jgi:DNA-binding LacI/PurR family transcriptional regulator